MYGEPSFLRCFNLIFALCYATGVIILFVLVSDSFDNLMHRSAVLKLNG